MFCHNNSKTTGLRRIVFLAAVLGTGIFGATGPAAASMAGMRVLGSAKAPIGYLGFCREHAPDCAPDHKQPVQIVLTKQSFDELVQVDQSINHRIKPATDMDVYGVAEKWEYPVDRGDCEDYVLLKRKTLLDAGWPQSALLITVVLDTHGDGHAVLSVVTDRGDYVLDNLTDNVLPWQQTGYRYVKRQSQYDEQKWVYVGPADAAGGVATAR
jgi:predicted transglutaminase-like cysteine proteinase